MGSKVNNARPVLKGLAMLAVFAGLVILARALGLEEHLADRQWLLAHVKGQGIVGVLFFVGLTGLVTGMGVPRQLTAFWGGYAFGWFWGSILATLGTALGCAMTFLLARTLGREFVLSRFSRRVERLDAFLRSDPWRSALAIRLFPVGHNMLTSVAAGVTSIPAAAFILGSAVGYLPQNLVFALAGAGISAQTGLGSFLSIGFSVLLLAASGWLGVSVYRAYKRKGALPVDDEGDDEGDDESENDAGETSRPAKP